MARTATETLCLGYGGDVGDRNDPDLVLAKRLCGRLYRFCPSLDRS